MIRVSVCLASYNGGQFIKRQVESILQQLGVGDELIISDDGSTDDTMQVIGTINDQRIIVYNNQGTHGPAGNFENALYHATGQLIVLSDQDDIWLPNKLSAVCLLLERCDLVLSDCEVVDLSGKVLQPSFFAFRGSRQGFWVNLYRNSYMGCCMAFRREVLTYALPFPVHIHMHDWWIGLLVEAKGRVLFYDKPLIQYVRHGSNASPTGEVGYGFFKRLFNRTYLFFNVVRRLLT